MSEPKITLMDLTGDYLQMLDLLDDPELDPQTLKDTMEGIEGAFEDKFDGYAAVLRQITGYVKTLEEEKKRLDDRIKVFQNNMSRMKEIMLFAMNATGKTKFKTAQNSFWTQKTTESVVIDAENVDSIPEEFLRFKAPEPDKTKIKEAIKAGVPMDGIAHLEQGETVRMK